MTQPHKKWAQDEIDACVDLYEKGFKDYGKIKEILGTSRSVGGIKGAIDRARKNRVLDDPVASKTKKIKTSHSKEEQCMLNKYLFMNYTTNTYI